MKKDCKIELYRFLAAIFIIMGHYWNDLSPDKVWPFSVSYQFVEFFFIVTGYFTARHFEGSTYLDESLKSVLVYDFNKFKRFIPYTIPAIVCVYAGEVLGAYCNGQTINRLVIIRDFLMEISFLSALKSDPAHIFIMWFLSAMFITLPVIIAFTLIPNGRLKIFLGTVIVGLFYIISDDYTIQHFPDQIIRAFMGMLLGVVIYYISQMVKEYNVTKTVKSIGTLVFVVAYIYPLYFAYKNYFILKEDLVCFIIWITLVMSDMTLFKPWHNRLVEFLGKFSMPIFIWHLPVIKFMLSFTEIENDFLRMMMCYALTFAVAGVNMYLVKLSGRIKCRELRENR